MSLLTQERDTYADIFSIDAYAEHSPGEHCADLFVDMTGLRQQYERTRYTVLDAGTGSGKGAIALQALGFHVRACDFVDGRIEQAQEIPFHLITTLWDALRPQVGYVRGGQFDYVYCTDVLEHIPPEFTMLTIQRLLDVTRHGLFLSISLAPDVFGAWVGRPLHRTVESYVWWRDHLNLLGRVAESRDRMGNGLYLVAPR